MSAKINLHFCTECNNLLYPRADPNRRIMVFACRICSFDEEGKDTCVYRNDLLTITKEQMGVITDIGSDPTLAHSNLACPSCGNPDSVFFQDQSKRRETRMILFYVCTACNTPFKDPNMEGEAEPLDDED